jgi:hypothetical protein
MEIEKLEDLAVALLDFTVINDLQAWLNTDSPQQPI